MAPFVYRSGRQVLILVRWVRLPQGAPVAEEKIFKQTPNTQLAIGEQALVRLAALDVYLDGTNAGASPQPKKSEPLMDTDVHK